MIRPQLCIRSTHTGGPCNGLPRDDCPTDGESPREIRARYGYVESVTRPTKERLEAIRSELRKSGWSRDMVSDLFDEIDALTAERDAAQHAEVSLHMRLTKLTAERDEARGLVRRMNELPKHDADDVGRIEALCKLDMWDAKEKKT